MKKCIDQGNRVFELCLLAPVNDLMHDTSVTFFRKKSFVHNSKLSPNFIAPFFVEFNHCSIWIVEDGSNYIHIQGGASKFKQLGLAVTCLMRYYPPEKRPLS